MSLEIVVYIVIVTVCGAVVYGAYNFIKAAYEYASGFEKTVRVLPSLPPSDDADKKKHDKKIQEVVDFFNVLLNEINVHLAHEKIQTLQADELVAMVSSAFLEERLLKEMHKAVPQIATTYQNEIQEEEGFETNLFTYEKKKTVH